MNTYQFIQKKSKRTAGVQRLILVGVLMLVLPAFGACRPSDGTAPVTPTGAPGPTEKIAEIPTSTPTSAPTQPTPTPLPPTATPLPTMAVIPESVFPVVSPVPQQQVEDIRGKFTRATFPVIDGSTATIPLSEALYQVACGATKEEAEQAISHTKTTNSYYRLYQGAADLLIVYEPAGNIVERMKTEPLLIKPIGLDALVFMTNTANPLAYLTLEQLVDIYSGSIKNWSEVGGEEKQLLAFQRPVGSGSQTLMQKLVMGTTAMAEGDNVFRYSTMSDILRGMLTYTGEDNTLGYSVFYYASHMHSYPELKFMGVDNVFPSAQTIYDGSYSLSNAFYAVIRPDEPAGSPARQLFDWLTAQEGQQLVYDLGYVPIILPKEGAFFEQQEPQDTITEVTAHAKLGEGEHYVMFQAQNAESEYLYGDAVIYDRNWEQVAAFYSVVIPSQVCGRYAQRYLPIGQIRQNADGEQQVYYGIYDLERQLYSVKPQFVDLFVVDVQKEYYAVLEQGRSYQEYFVTNGKGDRLLEDVPAEEWLSIYKCGNGYLDTRWNQYDEVFSQTIYFYDTDMRLRSIYFSEKEEMPAMEDRFMGVAYYYMGEYGCLVNEDGRMLICEEKFLERYGNGVDTECILPFYSLEMAQEDDDRIYAIEYAGEIYLTDKHLNLIKTVPKKEIANITQIEYHRDFYYGYHQEAGMVQYFTYEDEPLAMKDGMSADGVYTMWESENYILYRETENMLIIEEHMPSQGQMAAYEYRLQKESDDRTQLLYLGDGYILMADQTGKFVPNPYDFDSEEPMQLPVYSYTLYHGMDRIVSQEGLWTDTDRLSEGTLLLTVQSEQAVRVESESIFETHYLIQGLSRYFVINEEGVQYALRTPSCLQGKSDGFLQIKSGNYIYVLDLDGRQYIKTLNRALATD